MALKIVIWVFFRGLKSKSGYFLGFSKKISDEHTYHFYIKSTPAPPGDKQANCSRIKSVLQKAGINVDIFGAHSVRAASTSAAKVKGLPLDMIMSAAGWSNESTFEKFYCKAIDNIRRNFEQMLLKI